MWALMMRQDNGDLDEGDIVTIYDEKLADEAPWMGRVPLMDAGDGHEYGGMHSIVHVPDMSMAEGSTYLTQQFDSNGIGYDDTRNPLRNPDLKRKGKKLDINGKLPANRRSAFKGRKPTKFLDKFEDSIDKRQWKNKGNAANVADITMTRDEFVAATLIKPIPGI